MGKSNRKDDLIEVAQAYQGKPFFSKPLDARVRSGWVEIRHQASHELAAHWDQVINIEQLQLEIAHYRTRGDAQGEVTRLSTILDSIKTSSSTANPQLPEKKPLVFCEANWKYIEDRESRIGRSRAITRNQLSNTP